MRSELLHLAAAIAVAAAPLQAFAQVGPATGSRVRAEAPAITSERLVGTVAASTADSLLLSLAGGNAVVRLDRSSLQSLQVSRGRDRLRWAMLGAAGGMLVGGLVGGAVGGHDDTSGWGAFAGFMGGMIVGLPAGAVGGALLAPERWVDYSLPRRAP